MSVGLSWSTRRRDAPISAYLGVGVPMAGVRPTDKRLVGAPREQAESFLTSSSWGSRPPSCPCCGAAVLLCCTASTQEVTSDPALRFVGLLPWCSAASVGDLSKYKMELRPVPAFPRPADGRVLSKARCQDANELSSPRPWPRRNCDLGVPSACLGNPHALGLTNVARLQWAGTIRPLCRRERKAKGKGPGRFPAYG